VPVLGVVSNMGEFVCDECGTPTTCSAATTPSRRSICRSSRSSPFDPEMRSTPAPRADALPEHADDLAAAVDERYEEVWSVDPPADAVDLRGLDPETRTERVEERFRELDAGEECFIVSDRDPAPVRGSCWIWSTPTNSRVSVKRQNPETWFARATTRP